MFEIVCPYLNCGAPAAIIAGMLGEGPVLDEAGKDVFRDWVDAACLRAAEPAQIEAPRRS